jgi:hypothetical protein
LRRTHPELVFSNRRRNQVKRFELVRLKREGGPQSLCFSSRPFVLCGLPVRPLPAGQLIYERKNGSFALQITGHPDYGVPFGQDRIVPIFLATLAVQQQSQTFARDGTDVESSRSLHKDQQHEPCYCFYIVESTFYIVEFPNDNAITAAILAENDHSLAQSYGRA